MSKRIIFIIGLAFLSSWVAACSAPQTLPSPTATPLPTAAPQPSAATPPAGQLANPASENCVKLGGTLSIQKRGDGGEYGICIFADNMQCEEWAMLNGDCPVGGIKVTGYVTPAAQYCAITGGTYAVTGNSNTPNETGTCTFKTGATCDAAAYYDGICTATSGRPTPAVGGLAPRTGNYTADDNDSRGTLNAGRYSSCSAANSSSNSLA